MYEHEHPDSDGADSARTHSQKAETKRRPEPTRADCSFCMRVEGKGPCAKPNPDTGHLCTRPEGHSGPHVACSMTTHATSVWTDEPVKKIRWSPRLWPTASKSSDDEPTVDISDFVEDTDQDGVEQLADQIVGIFDELLEAERQKHAARLDVAALFGASTASQHTTPPPPPTKYSLTSQPATLAGHAMKLSRDLDELANEVSAPTPAPKPEAAPQADRHRFMISHGSTAADIWSDLIMVFDLPADTRTLELDARVLNFKRFE